MVENRERLFPSHFLPYFIEKEQRYGFFSLDEDCARAPARRVRRDKQVARGIGSPARDCRLSAPYGVLPWTLDIWTTTSAAPGLHPA